MKIVIDGLIGAGKSTQVGLLSSLLNMDVVKEPIADWPLDLFYSNPKRWGFLMQIAVLDSYIELKNKHGIFERCPESTKQVFWKNLVEDKIVTERENEIFQRIAGKLTWEPDVLIFIDKDPELCMEHIQSRNQEGDSEISLEYLKKLKNHYDIFRKNNPNAYVVNGNKTIEEINSEIVKIITPFIRKDQCQVTNVLM